MERPDTPSSTERVISLDCHLDVPWQLTKGGYRDLRGMQHDRMVDIPRMGLGQLDAAIFALYLSDFMQDQNGQHGSDYLIMHQYHHIKKQPGCTIVTSRAGVVESIDTKLVPIFLGLEGGRLINSSLERLGVFKEHGVRYLTLTHNRTSAWCDSATDEPEHRGLTKFGEDVVMECGRLDILVDVSHSSDDVVEAVLDINWRPTIASHSGCRKLVKHPRNLPDPLIKDIAKRGGVVCVPFATRFVGPYALGVTDHINHVVQLVGDSLHVGVGSDLDGAVMAAGISSVADWHDVVVAPLLDMGYKQADIDNIVGGNMLRLLG